MPAVASDALPETGGRAVEAVPPGRWLAVPDAASPRWVLPSGPRALARAGLGVYHPVTVKARLGWEAARALSWLGAFHLLPGRAAPAAEAWAAAAPHLPPGGSVATARATHAGRSVALVVAADGAPVAIVKLATDDEGREALAREAHYLARLGGLVAPPLRAPRIVAHAPGVLVVQAERWRPRWRAWRMPPDVAFALGRFFRAGARGDACGSTVGFAHGDVAPWNFLATERGWLLIDWESADEARPPFWDLMHFLTESYALLGRPSRRELLDGLRQGQGWIGAALAAYARGAGVPVAAARPHLLAYLEESGARVDPRGPAAAREREARRRIVEGLGS